MLKCPHKFPLSRCEFETDNEYDGTRFKFGDATWRKAPQRTTTVRNKKPRTPLSGSKRENLLLLDTINVQHQQDLRACPFGQMARPYMIIPRPQVFLGQPVGRPINILR